MSVRNYAQLKSSFLQLNRSEVRFKTPLSMGNTTVLGLKMNKLMLVQIYPDYSTNSISRVEDEDYYETFYNALIESI